MEQGIERPPGTKTVLNCGAGRRDSAELPAFFDDWRQIRIDLDPSVEPDVVASITDLSDIPDGAADAVWTAHCVEHLYSHQVPAALSEFRRVLNDTGFLCIFVPDLQAVAERIASDGLDAVAYDSPAGPITPHDILFGFSPALERGQYYMAHRCGFTQKVLWDRLKEAGFAEAALGRNSVSLELGALAARSSFGGQDRCMTLLKSIGR